MLIHQFTTLFQIWSSEVYMCIDIKAVLETEDATKNNNTNIMTGADKCF